MATVEEGIGGGEEAVPVCGAVAGGAPVVWMTGEEPCRERASKIQMRRARLNRNAPEAIRILVRR
jgi:hypothetical protein